MASSGRRPAGRGHLRIIGGQWRSRQLQVAPAVDLRPTPDRVRETLFNWIEPWVGGADCLDLFAGSGALGLEALSRGAASAVLVERDPAAIAVLRLNVAALAARDAEVVAADCLDYLQGAGRQFDIVFVDPPYRSGLLGRCCVLLAAGGWVRPGGLVYLEASAAQMPELPEGWTLERSKRAGQVGYHLARSGLPPRLPLSADQ
ncbi:MAG: 16S rRNA (guanine(966)-N(2))-methyltransferase RsmD [Gammaproteobacteria bacterium]|nr:16S rRNA (guanine(966)-N(2))-methyltransferase RsmD [Gammaproteobacteria bacterium]